MKLLIEPWSERPLAAVPRARLTQLVQVEPSGPYVWPMHHHPDHEMILVDRGEYQCTVNGSSVSVPSGSILLVRPGDSHQDVLKPPLSYRALSFFLSAEKRNQEARLAIPEARPQQLVGRDKGGLISAAIERLAAEKSLATPSARSIASGALEEIVWRIARILPTEVVARAFRELPADRSFVEDLQRVFQTRMERSTSVAEIAKAMNTSPSALTQRCRAILGASPAQAFLNYRLDHAAAALTQAAVPVKTIAEKLGFSDQFHFSRAFKRRFGYPPSRV